MNVLFYLKLIDFYNAKYILQSGDFSQHRISRLVLRIVETMSINYTSFLESIIQALIKSLIRHPVTFCFRDVKGLANIPLSHQWESLH